MLSRLSRLLRGPKGRGRVGRAPRRPLLEVLEDRTVLSNLFVVSPTTPAGPTNFFSLQAAVSAAQSGDTITVEPGAADAGSNVSVATNAGGSNLNNLTIQGDPNAAAAGLPAYSLALGDGSGASGNGVTLRNLNLISLTLTGSSGDRITGSLIASGGITEFGPGHNTITGNTINGSVSLSQSTGDVFTNNAVNLTGGGTGLALSGASGATVQANRFNLVGTSTGSVTGISVSDSTGLNINTNTITTHGGTASNAGISIQYQFLSTASMILVDADAISAGPGTGLAISVGANTDANVQVVVQGTGFNNSGVGVAYTGKGGSPGSTLGGTNSTSGAVSLGNNNFRHTGTAVAVSNIAAGASLPAQFNAFTLGAAPNVSGPADTTNALNANQGFVANLYRYMLGQTPSQGQVNSWTTLAAQGPATVAQDFAAGGAGLAQQVNLLYLQFLHRPADNSGLAFFVGQIQAGGTLESVEAQILTSQEFLSLSGGGGIQTYYQLLLGRTAGASELAFWQGQQAGVGLLGVVQGILNSTEFRAAEVQRLYQQLLHRSASQSEVAFWAPQGFIADELGILSSSEFFANG